MACLSRSVMLLLLSIFCISVKVEPAFQGHSKARAYIEASCRTTRYPKLCIQCLTQYANSTIQTPQQLAQVALSVSLYRAQNTKAYMFKAASELKAMKAKEYQVVKDCLDQINDGINQLRQSISELHRLEGREAVDNNIIWHINNIETWVSTAVTDAATCLDEFPARTMSKLKATIKGKVLNVAQTACNALALFHRYAARYRATTKP